MLRYVERFEKYSLLLEAALRALRSKTGRSYILMGGTSCATVRALLRVYIIKKDFGTVYKYKVPCLMGVLFKDMKE